MSTTHIEIAKKELDGYKTSTVSWNTGPRNKGMLYDTTIKVVGEELFLMRQHDPAIAAEEIASFKPNAFYTHTIDRCPDGSVILEFRAQGTEEQEYLRLVRVGPRKLETYDELLIEFVADWEVSHGEAGDGVIIRTGQHVMEVVPSPFPERSDLPWLMIKGTTLGQTARSIMESDRVLVHYEKAR